MREAIMLHPVLCGILGGVFLSMLIVFPLAIWQRRTFLKFEEHQPIVRRVDSMEMDDDGVVSVKLECGHRIGFQFPDSLPCPPCSNEVEALKRMAGAK